MSLANNVVSGLKWVLLEKTGVQIGTFLVFMFLARQLGPETFGLVALSKVFIDLASFIVQQGIAQALIQRSDVEPEHYDSAFWFNMFVAVIMAVIFIGGADVVASLYDEPQLSMVIRALSVIIFCTALVSVQQAILRKNLQFKQMAVRTLIASTVSNILAVVMVLFDFGVWSLIGREIANAVISVGLLWYISGWRPKFRFSLPHFKQLYAQGIHFFTGNIISFFAQKSDALLIGFFLNVTAVGYYNVAQRLLTMVNSIISQTIGKVAFPVFSKMQNDLPRLSRSLFRMTEITSIVAFPVFILMSGLADNITSVFFGDKWLPSVPVMEWIVLTGIAKTITYPANSFLFGTGRAAVSNQITLLEAVLRVVAVVASVSYGIEATAFSVTAILFCTLPVWVIVLLKCAGTEKLDYVRSLYPAITCSIAMGIFLVLCESPIESLITQDLVSMFVIGALGAIVYSAVLAIFFRSTCKNMLSMVGIKTQKSKSGTTPEGDSHD